jgi:RHS repeat-associated protein
LTSENNPENGLTQYFNDTDPGTVGTACPGPYNGDLVKRYDAVGNTTCYAYDSLHRVTSITYSGSYASSTPNKYFVYDSATVNGATMANAKGHLAEAYTATCSTCSRITDEGFSYSVRGEVADIYQMTPHSGGYYHVNAIYWAHGVLNQLSGLPGLPTVSYGVDGEGRPYSTSAASGQNPVSSTSYNVFSEPTQVNFGSSDNDAFSYDGNTGRMTQYQFNVNNQSNTGALTWNANGTLNQLGITDAFNSMNNQTCNYTHDDLVRIATANCGSVFSGTYTYDAFGNINKTGTFSFQPTYSPTSNRMSSLPGYTPTYDANGNMLADSLHSYAWDAEGRPVTTDTVSVTYDALGRMVEQNLSGTYTEIAYAPTGNKLALMSGQTLQKAFVPLPGGATAVYNSSGLAYYRHPDWLGSSRLASTPSRGVYFDSAYGPFGEPYAQSGTADLSFTGQNQDTVAALYDFYFREYGIQGRWPFPDPAGLAAVDPTNPQSWNRYTYVLNEPLSYIDPLGLFTFNHRKKDDEQLDINDAKNASNRVGCSVSIGLLILYFTSCPFNAGAARGGWQHLFEKLASFAEQAVKAACSAVPDAFTNGVGGDAGLFMTGGGQIGTIANGRTGEFSFYATGDASFGLISFDAFVAAGFVMNLPANSNLNTNAYVSRAFGFYRFGGSGGSGSYQATAGPSFSPATAAKQVSATRVSPSIPLLGYALNLPRAACKLATGH